MKKKILYSFLIILTIFHFSCGKEDEDTQMYLSGQLEIEENATGPAFVAISKSDDFDQIESNPTEYMAGIVMVDPADYSFFIDLSFTGLVVGQEIFIFGFVDNDYNNGVPNPSEGDSVGFYFEKEDFKMSYILKKGMNGDIQLSIDRKVYDFEAEVSGTINGDYQGEIMVLAYTGELSFDFGDIDTSGVIGFKKLTKGKGPLSYTMDIFPFGHNVPIENVYIIAMYDNNGNGKPDGGDLVGFYSEEANQIPTLITIDEGTTTNKVIDIVMKLDVPGGYDVPLTGTIELPDGHVYDGDPSKALMLCVAKTDDPNLTNLMDDPMDYMKYFKIIRPSETGVSSTDYSIDLSDTDLKAGDDILVMAFWFTNYTGAFGFPQRGDYAGFYLDIDSMSPTYKLQDGQNEKLNFKISRAVYSFDAEISGKIECDDADCKNDDGDLMIVAYAGELTSMDFQNIMDVINFDDVVGYQTIDKDDWDGYPINYNITVMPFGQNVPMSNVLVMGLLDKNDNGKFDGGDKVCFYIDKQQSAESGMEFPSVLRVEKGETANIDLQMALEIPEPAGHNITIEGSFEKPPGYNEYSAPIFLMIAQFDDPKGMAIMFEKPMKAVKYLCKMPPGENEFSVDLSGTDVAPGDPEHVKDDIVVIAFWDKDYNGFVNFTPGDYIGMMQNKTNFAYSWNQVEGVNHITSSGYEIKLNRKMYSHNSSINFWLNKGLWPFDLKDNDNIMMVVIHKDGLDYTNMSMNMDYVIANMSFDAKYGEANKFNMKLFPMIYDGIPVKEPFAIDDIFIIGINDKNRNEMPDVGERIAFYWYQFLPLIYLPNYWDLKDGENNLTRSVRFSEFFSMP